MKAGKTINKHFVVTICAILLMVGIAVIFSSDDSYAASKKLSTPKIDHIENWGSEALGVEWDYVKNADYYAVYRATTKNGKYKRIKTTDSTFYLDKSVKENKTYYYKIKAFSNSKYKNSNFSKVKSKKFKFIGIIECDDVITIYSGVPYYLNLITVPSWNRENLVRTQEDIIVESNNTKELSCTKEFDLFDACIVMECNKPISGNNESVYYVTMKYKKHKYISKQIKVIVKNPLKVPGYDKDPNVPDFGKLTGIKPERVWYKGNQMVYRTTKYGTFADYTLLLEDMGYRCLHIDGNSENSIALFSSFKSDSMLKLHIVYDDLLDPVIAVEIVD